MSYSVYGMQAGAGYPVYGMQTGQGFFGAIARMLGPALKTAARVAAPAAKRIASTAARDLLSAGVTTGLEALEVRYIFLKLKTCGVQKPGEILVIT